MSNTIKYKGYVGTLEYSAEDDCMWGKVINADGLAVYSGKTLDEAKKAFYAMVDGEIEDEKLRAKEYKGKINVRLSPELHEKLAIYSATHDQSLNKTIKEAVFEYVANDGKCSKDKT